MKGNPGPTLRVVILDDHASVGRLLHHELEASGWNAMAFTNPHEALTHMESQPVDVLITDQRMPGLTGVAVVTLLRDRGWTGAVLFLTGSPGDLDAAVIKRLGVLGVLEKPVGIRELKYYLHFIGTPGTSQRASI